LVTSPEVSCPECRTLDGHYVETKTYAVAIRCPEMHLTYFLVKKTDVEAWSKARHYLRPNSEQKERIWRYYLKRLQDEGVPLLAESKKWFDERIYEGYFASYDKITEAVNDLIKDIASAKEMERVAWTET